MLLSTVGFAGIFSPIVWLVLTLISIGLAAYCFLINIRLRQQLESVSEDVQSLSLKRDFIADDLQPHFLFNVMAAIQHLVLNGEKKQAIRYFSVLGKYLRISLEQDANEKMTQDRLLKALQNYVELEGLRYEKEINLEFAIASDVQPLYIEYPYHLILNEIKKLINERLRYSSANEEFLEVKIEREIKDIVILLSRKEHSVVTTDGEQRGSKSHIFRTDSESTIIDPDPVMIRFTM